MKPKIKNNKGTNEQSFLNLIHNEEKDRRSLRKK